MAKKAESTALVSRRAGDGVAIFRRESVGVRGVRGGCHSLSRGGPLGSAAG